MMPFRQTLSLLLLLLTGLVNLSVSHAQQMYPGAGLFGVQCGNNSLIVLQQGAPLFEVTLTQLSAPLATAVALRQNQPIATGSGAALWALQSYELQIHRNEDPDSTKLVVPATICGQPPRPMLTGGVVLVYVQVNGSGQGVAYAAIAPDGSVVVFAATSGNAQAGAFAQSSTVPAASGRTHVVQPGETLFRIALRYNTTVTVLATLNHLSDPNRIMPGQVLLLP